jgi:hypothetical protein
LRLGRGVSTLLVALSLVLALCATVVAATIPFYTGVHASDVSVSESGRTATQPTIETRHATLVEINGPGVLRVLAIPMALSTLALVASGTQLGGTVCGVCAALSLGFCVVTGFSVGLFYAPSALALGAATLLHAFRAAGEA